MTTHQEFVDQILDMEWIMFIHVKADRPAPCQGAPVNFRNIRGCIFETWTDEMLASYLNDLVIARDEGRNLLTEKYARMDNLIRPLKSNAIIEKIVTVESRWQSEIQDKYPSLYEQCCRKSDPTGDGRNFSIYLKSELETYSDHTLALYYENVNTACEMDINLALNALQRLVQKNGYHDLNHAENHLNKKAG